MPPMHNRAGPPYSRDAGPPLVLVPGGERAGAALAAARARLRASGWQVVTGLGSRPAGGRTILEGPVTCDEDAASAVLAAIDGYGLLVVLGIDGAALHRLEDDLRRLGAVEIADSEPAVGSRPPDPDGLAILALLASGHSLGEAADTLGLSRRTADRRLAAAKAALGADRTTEAIAVAARRGLLEQGRPD